MLFLIRRHYCWCDSIFCGCKHEIYDMEKKIKYMATLGTIHAEKKIWSSYPPTSANYTKREGEKDMEWDPEEEIKSRGL